MRSQRSDTQRRHPLNHPTARPTGGDHRRRLHGGVGPAGAERHQARRRDRRHVAGHAGGSAELQDPTPARTAAQAADRPAHGSVVREGEMEGRGREGRGGVSGVRGEGEEAGEGRGGGTVFWEGQREGREGEWAVVWERIGDGRGDRRGRLERGRDDGRSCGSGG